MLFCLFAVLCLLAFCVVSCYLCICFGVVLGFDELLVCVVFVFFGCFWLFYVSV